MPDQELDPEARGNGTPTSADDGAALSTGAQALGDGRAEHHRIVIIGAGFAGIGAAIKLMQAGFEDFVVLERADDVGGTWQANTYPGCQCDIPSHLYSFSFALNPDWSRAYSMQPEIWDYLRRVAREHGVDRHVRLCCDVTRARWEQSGARWLLQTSAGEISAELLIAGVGPLSQPKWPAIEGLDRFAGTTVHSARWDARHSLSGERVALIGTGASAIQIVPRIQPEASRLLVFQRTAPWVMPHADRPVSRFERLLYRAFPPAQRIARMLLYARQEMIVPFLMRPGKGSVPERVALRHLQSQVPDPQLRAKLTPSYRLGCKRVLLSNDYFPALQQPNVELVTDPIRAVTAKGVLTADGSEHEVDTIVYATGFHVTDMPLTSWLYARDGRTLDEHWQGSPQAYLGTTIAGCPNLFMLVGPNTGLGHNSLVFMIESQLNYVMDCIRHLEGTDTATFEVREDVQREFNDEIQRRLAGSVWNRGGCASWYLDVNGKNTVIWPGSTWPYRQRLRRFDPRDYDLRPRAPALAPRRPARGRPTPHPAATGPRTPSR
jgi:cation diffusion facilitator CzcD-associated flavoprotein CzcO